MKRSDRIGWAAVAALALGMAAAIVAHPASLAPEYDRLGGVDEPTATVATAEPTTGTWSGDDLFTEVAAHAGIPTDRIPEARALAQEMCKALEAGGPESPADILQDTREASADLGPNAPGVVTEFGIKAYCPDLVAVLR